MVAALLSTLMAVPTLVPAFALIRSTEYVSFSNVSPNTAVLHGPHCYGCLGMYPFLTSTDPSGRLVCVGWADANDVNHNSCIIVSGSGSGSSTSITAYDMWINVDSITITTINGQTTFYYN